ncbi:MAG: hypothetical protein U1E38_08395 [Rhodospirillales bacterium]
MHEQRKRHLPPPDDGPPTLPLPSTWRLIVAAIAIIGVLYLMYETARDAEVPPPPAPASPAASPGNG